MGFADFLGNIPIVGDALNTVADPLVNTDQEQESNDLQDRSNELIEQLYNQAPTQYDLSGYGMFGGQMPESYLNDYLASGQGQTPTSFADYTGTRRDGNTAMGELIARMQQTRDANRGAAQQSYVMDQIARDPLAFLQVNPDSALAGAHADPRAMEAQRRALSGLRNIYEQGGYTEQERGQNRLAQQDAARFEQSQRAALQQQAAMRGMNNSGAAMMGALAAQQGGANRAADSATQYNIAGHQRALDALTRYGDQAGQMRNSSWNEDITRRGALDNWNQYRTNLIGQRQAQWGANAGDAYNTRQNAGALLTNQWGGNIQRNDQDDRDFGNSFQWGVGQLMNYAGGSQPGGSGSGGGQR
jgi:hypothetical protein